MAESPMLDLLAHEAAAIRWLTDAALAEFLTDVERIGWDEARHTLKRHRQRGRTWGGEWCA